MPETTQDYSDRLAGYVDGLDPLIVQQETPDKLARLIHGIPVQQLSGRPEPGKWSIIEILAHMAEDELVSSWRYRQMIEHDGEVLHGFDQDLWARLGNYGEWSASEALDLFRLLRNANLRMLRALSPEEWERSGNHMERGRITVRELARHMAAHDINHILQIEACLR